MAFDYKNECKALYMPPKTPGIIQVPPMNYLAVRGKGNPNDEQGEYSRALNLLYGVAYTIKMSSRGPHQIEGYFDYVVPPLEGFWWQEGIRGVNYARKADFSWVALIRLPDFVKPNDVQWATDEAQRKKQTDFSPVAFLTYNEGLCVQCMHVGPYDDEPQTVGAMERFAHENGYAMDITDTRHHHEIYLTDPRKTQPAKLKTVIRHPIKKMGE